MPDIANTGELFSPITNDVSVSHKDFNPFKKFGENSKGDTNLIYLY